MYIYELDWISIVVEVRNNKASLGKSAYRTGQVRSDPAGTKVEVEVSGESSWGQQSTGWEIRLGPRPTKGVPQRNAYCSSSKGPQRLFYVLMVLCFIDLNL